MIPHTDTPPTCAPTSPFLRRVVTASCAAAALPTIVGSFAFQRDYAAESGWPGWTSWLFPLSVDALAVAAWAAGTARAAWGPRICGAVAVLVSAAGNIAGHALSSGEMTWNVFLSGAWPPVAMALIVYLFFLVRSGPLPIVAPAPITSSTVAEAAAVVGEPDAATSGPAAPTPAPVHAEGSAAGEPQGVGAADQIRGELAGMLADFRRNTEPTPVAPTVDDTPVADEAWAATVTDEQLVEDAARRGKASVRKLIATYGISHGRARTVARLADKTSGGVPCPAPRRTQTVAAVQGPAAAGLSREVSA